MGVLQGIAVALGVALAAAVAVGLVLRQSDRRTDDRVWRALDARRDPAPALYDPAMIAGLPDIAHRYFARAIQPGTPLSPVVALEMNGTFLLNGTELPMRARQILAPPDGGFVWQAEIGSGLMRMVGSDGLLEGPDGQSWTRFWLQGLVPLVRAGGSADHRRSARTRLMMEAVWAPAALLPQAGATWRQVAPDIAEVSLAALGDIAPMRLTIDADGFITEMTAPRWSDANADRIYRLQPFGGQVLDHARFGGFTVPARVEMGNLWGTPDYAPFFRATITAAHH